LFLEVRLPRLIPRKDVSDHSTIFATVQDTAHVALAGSGTARTKSDMRNKTHTANNMIKNLPLLINGYYIKIGP